MPRRLRIEAPGATHHAIPKGNNDQRIVVDDHDRRALLGRVETVVATFRWDCIAYCLMDNHIHLVVRTSEPNLGAGMQKLLGWYAFRFNRRHGGYGHVFYGPFWSRLVEDGTHLLAACLYSVLNPVAAGVCGHPSAWPWCSFRATAGLGPPGFVASDPLLRMLGETMDEAQQAYRTLVDTGVERVKRAADWRAVVLELARAQPLVSR